MVRNHATACVYFLIAGLLSTFQLVLTDSANEEPPEGYYAFVEAPNAEPPRLRGPPYTDAAIDCPEEPARTPHVSQFNLCGDLNKGVIPRNPMGQNVLGHSYPFELLKNETLRFFSKALPILKADKTMPKVAKVQEEYVAQNSIDRSKRSADNNEEDTSNDFRQPRNACDSDSSLMCKLYNLLPGTGSNARPKQTIVSSGSPERRDDSVSSGGNRYDGPPTPCPAKVEYATPVFAKNYQGVWRYVVQIPYEGYFTQTVEVIRCVQSQCHYLQGGGCLSSPRWTSLLVAEIYYPDTVLGASSPSNGGDLTASVVPGSPQRHPVSPVSQPPSVQDFQNYQQYLHKRAGLQAGMSPADTAASTPKPNHCDGIDALGCFQVRLYYDWFLIPGSCKCWRPDYFNKYVRRKASSGDL